MEKEKKVLVRNHVVNRHDKQICKGSTGDTEHKTDDELFDILLDTFSIPKQPTIAPNVDDREVIP